jgi:hypothetical protein
VDKDDFDKKFSLAKTLTNIRNSSNAKITRAVLNSRMRAKFVLRGVRSMILNLKNNFADVSQAINDENGYCELQVKFDKDTNKLEITL